MSSRPFIVIGDRTDHGGIVVGSSASTRTHGMGIARVGDQVTCPKKGHGTTVIVTGDPTMIIDGAPAARHGDKCACGATLISSQAVSTTSDGGAIHALAPDHTTQSSTPTRMGVPTGIQALFDDRLALMDDDSGRPLSHMAYAIKRASGAIEHGITSAEGHTHLLTATAKAESVDIYL